MSLAPLNDNVIVKRDEAESRTPGGIVLPDMAKDKPQKGRVLAVGPGRVNDNGGRVAIGVKEGQHVLFAAFGGHEIEFDGEKLLVLNQNEIIAVIE